MNPATISEEALNAYVDGQLAPDERLRVLEAAQRDEALAARICALRQSKDLVRMAFADPPPPRRAERRQGLARGWGLGAAALLLLGLGGVGGWFAHGNPAVPVGFRMSTARHVAPGHFILHVADADPTHMKAALDDTEALFRRYRNMHVPVHIEVVVNGEGLALLNADTSPYGRRIRELIRRYQGVSFLACANALERMRLEGRPVRLLPEAHVIEEGALDRIIARLEEGWSYIRV
jgi:hypothetical protein